MTALMLHRQAMSHTGLAMQDLQIEDVVPETDPNLKSHDEDIMMKAFGASLDKSTCLDHSIWTER